MGIFVVIFIMIAWFITFGYIYYLYHSNLYIYEDKFIMEKELSLFGLYLSNHPVTDIKNKYNNITSLMYIESYFDKTIDIIVYVDRIKEINTKKGEKMAFIVGSDELSTIDITLFPKIYSNINIKVGDIILVRGKVEKRFDKYQIIISEIKKL